MATITLNINGMTCGGCVQSIIRVLNNLNGVLHADVRLEEHHAIVEFDENKIQITQLVEAIEDAGYDVTLA